MKANLLNKEGKTVKQIELPKSFNQKIREDIIHKAYVAGLKKQPFGSYPLAGMEVSAQGKQSHQRGKYKTLYGKGISRIPRKTMSRRGDQFYWVGAYIPGTVKGRRAHPPQVLSRPKKMNKKEKKLAIESAIAATASKNYFQKKYPDMKLTLDLPLIIESSILNEKEKEIVRIISNILGFKIKKTSKIRAGRGKMRGRKHKKQSKVLLVVSDKEKIKKLTNYGLEVSTVRNLNLNTLASGGIPGRFTVYTENSLGELK